MCKYVVIDKPLVKEIAEKIVEEMIDDRTSNPHGTGVYFFNHSKNNLFVRKGYGKTPDEDVEKVLENCMNKFTKGSLLIIHNRYATSGSQSKSQCHPIPIEHCDEYGKNIYEGGFVIHNGVLPKYEVEGINNLSDTQIVGRVLGQGMYDHDIHTPHEFGNKRGKEFGEVEFAGSKVTVVHNNEFYTINAKLGVKEDGIGKTCSKHVASYGCSTYDYGQEKIPEPKARVIKDGDSYYTVYEDEYGQSILDENGAIPDYDPKAKK